MLDQVLWRANSADDKDTGTIAAFLQYGYSDPRVATISQHVGGGVTWTGAIPSRQSDVLGLGASLAIWGDDPTLAGAELEVELFYKLQLTPYLSIRPDLQYIHNPGGVKGRDAALVGTLRVVIEF